jgi:hypothetical protein
MVTCRGERRECLFFVSLVSNLHSVYMVHIHVKHTHHINLQHKKQITYATYTHNAQTSSGDDASIMYPAIPASSSSSCNPSSTASLPPNKPHQPPPPPPPQGEGSTKAASTPSLASPTALKRGVEFVEFARGVWVSRRGVERGDGRVRGDPVCPWARWESVIARPAILSAPCSRAPTQAQSNTLAPH